MYVCKYESRMEKDPGYSWDNVPIQHGVAKFLAKWSAEPNLILSIDIALYSFTRVSGVIRMPRSMVELVNA